MDSFDAQDNFKPDDKKYHPEALKKYGWILQPREKKETEDVNDASEDVGADTTKKTGTDLRKDGRSGTESQKSFKEGRDSSCSSQRY